MSDNSYVMTEQCGFCEDYFDHECADPRRLIANLYPKMAAMLKRLVLYSADDGDRCLWCREFITIGGTLNHATTCELGALLREIGV